MEEKNTLSIKRKIGLALAVIGVLVFIFGIILSVKIKVVGGIIISICAASIFICAALILWFGIKRMCGAAAAIAAAAILIAVSVFFMYSEKNGYPDINISEKAVGVILALVFMALGLFFPIAQLIDGYIKKNRYCDKVWAKCVGYYSKRQRRYRRSVTVYAPIWEYEYHGRMYKQSEKRYTDIGLPQAEHYGEIRINPENPNDIYRKNQKDELAQTVAYAFIVCIGLFMGFAFIMNL